MISFCRYSDIHSVVRGENVGAPLPRDLALVGLEAQPAHPVLPFVPGPSPAGVTHVHDGVDDPA
eukprot:7366924-Prymnesium_polylepis.1